LFEKLIFCNLGKKAMEEMINAHHLCKKFKGKTAVQDISFSIGKGEIFGFLGHNGAGKTTTIRMLTGQIYPTSGYSEIAGFNSITEQDLLKPLIGVVADVQNLYERMSGIENLKLFADLFEVNTARIHELLELVHLETYSFPFAEMVLTFMNFLPVESRWPVISQAIPKCGSATQRVA